jgi:hypothetical protein
MALTAVTVLLDEFGGPGLLSSAEAQQMGRDPWTFPQSTRGFSAQAQLMRKQQSASGESGGSGSGNAYVTNNLYSNTSTSIGNLNEISQVLGEGATALITQNTSQDNLGNTKSSASSSSTTWSSGSQSIQAPSSQQAQSTTNTSNTTGGLMTNSVHNGN